MNIKLKFYINNLNICCFFNVSTCIKKPSCAAIKKVFVAIVENILPITVLSCIVKDSAKMSAIVYVKIGNSYFLKFKSHEQKFLTCSFSKSLKKGSFAKLISGFITSPINYMQKN